MSSVGECRSYPLYSILKSRAEPGPREGGRPTLTAEELADSMLLWGEKEVPEEVLECLVEMDEVRPEPALVDRLLRQPWATGKRRQLLGDIKAGQWGPRKAPPPLPPRPPSRPPEMAPPPEFLPPAEPSKWGLPPPSLTGAFATLNYDLNLGAGSYGLGPEPTGMRNFRQDSGFPVGLAMASIEWGPHPDLLFHTDLIAGRDEPLMNPEGLGVHTDRFGGTGLGLWQVYGQYGRPDRNFLRFGRWGTPVGAEGAGPDNPTITRSFLFEYAEPLSHVGISGTVQAPRDEGGINFGICNGWDHLVGSRPFQSAFLKFFFNVPQGLATSFTVVFSQDEIEGAPISRGLANAVADWRPTDRDRFLFSVDDGGDAGYIGGIGRDGNIVLEGDPPTGHWFGSSLVYERREGPYRLAARTEAFYDSGIRTGVEDVWYGEGTLAAGRQFGDHFQARAEYRHDMADRPAFPRQDGGTSRSQDTVSLEAVFSY